MSTAQQGYRIDTVVGPMARWMPSIEAAKERYLESIAETYVEVEEQAPVVTFESSTEGENGEALPPYLRCLEDGRWQASISPERPAWPSSEVLGHGDSPPLAMVAVNVSGACTHRVLTCSGTTEPRIDCTMCGQMWMP